MISRFLPATIRRLLGRPVTARPPGFQLIDRPQDLEPFLNELDRASEVALDTEADNMYHYRNRVCFLQFLVQGRITLVDPLAKGLDLEPIWRMLGEKHLIMHGSDFDLRLLHDLCGFRARSLFDTVLAAQLLGRQRIGLAALLEDHFGVKLDKAGQKANWSKRPLPEKLLDYAALDVSYLPQLRDILTRQLASLDRMEWLEQQCEAQIVSGATGFAPRDENDWRIGRSERLKGRGLAVLHAVWHWREAQAQRLDVPPFKVCSNDLLLKLAFAADEPEATEGTVLGTIHLGRRHDRIFPSLAEAVRSGFARDPKTLPRRPGRDPRYTPLTQAEVELLERIRSDRDAVAKRLEIDPTLIANRSQLAQIARDPSQLDEILLRWQADLLRRQPALGAAAG
jgi:ribonuclease D